MTEYNLLTEPVVYAYFTDGSQSALSIKEVFQHADSIASVGGDSPLQEFPIVRLFVAIMYGALKDELTDRDSWLELWENGLPLEKINAYLNERRERFNLFSDVSPFYQIVGAEYVSPKEPNNAELILDLNKVITRNKEDRYHFSTVTEKGVQQMDYAEAARRLIELQNYRTASRHSVIKGDNRVKKLLYSQLGWSGNLTGVLLMGRNFKETLLLNAPPYEQYPNVNPMEDLPVWDRPVHTAAAERMYGDLEEYGLATGPADILTVQAARVTLHEEGGSVVASTIGVGDRLFVYDQNHAEPMSSWRLIKRENGSEVFSPLRMNTAETWRGLEALLALTPSKTPQERALTLKFFQRVTRKIGLHYVTVKTFDVSYGTQAAIIDDINTSSLSLPAFLLAPESAVALERAVQAVDKAKQVARIVSQLQANVYVAEGKERKPAKGVSVYTMAKPVEEEFLSQLDAAYKLWVHDLTEINYDAKYNEWLDLLKVEARASAQQILASPSPRSLQGSLDGSSLFNIFNAESIFDTALHKETKHD